MERGIEEVPRAVAGEHPPGAIGPVRPGREPEHEQAGPRVAEARHRLAPVLAVAVGGPLLAGHALAPGDEARTGPTGDDVPLDGGEGIRHAET